MSEQILIWCENCERFVNAEPKDDHDNHKRVGLTEDSYKYTMKLMVRELRRTNRLITVK